ncbi:MAG: hypothetical protein HY360_07815 [Verrucomicrobia bacterium]|nr:hypothetical protein [Verrucomicrobiota bacterium]
MQIHSSQEQLHILLEKTEADFLARVFRTLDMEYRIPPAEMDSKIERVWYSDEGHQSAGSSVEDREEWRRMLHEFRGENTKKIKSWLSTLQQAKNSIAWNFPLADAETLLAVVNDYRLALASKCDVAETEMEHDLDLIQDPVKRTALMEIHFLAWMMELILAEIG